MDSVLEASARSKKLRLSGKNILVFAAEDPRDCFPVACRFLSHLQIDTSLSFCGRKIFSLIEEV